MKTLSATRRIGKYTLTFDPPPVIAATGVVAGPKEARGPLSSGYDHTYPDQTAGKKTFEEAEREMMLNASFSALNRLGLSPEDVDLFLAGDLLNQTVTANFSALKLGMPFMGLYGACATLGQALIVGSSLLVGGFASRILLAVSSHNSAAERQYRYPTEYGIKRPPQAQWTVTAAGAAVLDARGSSDIGITSATVGRVMDMGCRDVFDLGGAMAPAAVDTMIRHFTDMGRAPSDYDLIATGDLGKFGRQMAVEMASLEGGFTLGDNYFDCGEMIYDLEKQDAFSGGSGAGCSAAVLMADILPRLRQGKLKRILLVTTGALHSPTIYQQGEHIPTTAHAVTIERLR